MFDQLAADVSKKTTVRYAIALSLIACVLVFNFLLLDSQLSANSSDGFIINISGQQRMLSQRIGLMSHELMGVDDAELAEQLAGKLQVAVDQMRQNHANLVDGRQNEMSQTLEKLYFGEGAVDKDVRHFVSLAAQLLNAHRISVSQKNDTPDDGSSTGTAVQTRLMDEIVRIARNGLLARLDRVVSQYQIEYEAKVAWFRKAEQICLLVGFALLAMEVLFIFRPMTRTIKNSVDELSNTNAELREFAYRVSHDLRAPIKSSLGLTELMQDSLQDGEVEFTSEALGQVHQSMTKLDQLISDIAELTRVRNADRKPEPVNVADLVRDAIEMVSHLPAYDAVKIHTDIKIDQRVVTERLFLQQTLANLISNGIKYYDPEKAEPMLEISAAIINGECVIHVTDNGIGIPEDCRDDIFGMFKRFHPRHSFGSGLGLYLVKKNVDRLGGRLVYEPLPNGTRFSVYVVAG